MNIGAAGTFVIRKPVAREALRREIADTLPFDAGIVICQGREILDLLSADRFPRRRRGVVRFVSVLSRLPRAAPPLPIALPSRRAWLLNILGREGRFVFGLYRRDMKVIRYLGMLDEMFGVPATTRNWNTLAAIANVLSQERVFESR